MPREYQKSKNNPYLLPHNLYMRVLYIIKDYDRLKGEYHAILDSGIGAGGVVGASPTSNEPPRPTEDVAIRLALVSDELHAIEQALLEIPGEYRAGLMHNIVYGVSCPDFAHYNTWRNQRYKLCYKIAKRLKLA